MKKFILFSLVIFFCPKLVAQVGINNTSPNATLDIEASNVATPNNDDGILIPRIDDFPLTNPTASQDGMMVFATGNGTPSKGFYYWDNGSTSWIVVSSTGGSDADWYEENTTTPPTSNSADIFTDGNVGIGVNTVAYPLQIETPSSTRTVNLLNENTGSSVTGLRNTLSESAASSNGSTNGIVNSITRTNQSTISGVSNSFSNSVVTNSFGYLYGYQNSFGTSTATNSFGLLNRFQGVATTASGLTNLLGNSITTFYGVDNHDISGSAISGNFYGVYNNMANSGSGDRYGVYTNFSETGSGNKYGEYINISTTAGGTHYGIYADVRNAAGYAGYFLGRTSLGTGTTNRYLMPATDGTAGQVMTTNGVGVVTFQDVNSTDDQIIDQFDLSGTTLRLSLEDDGLPLQTVNLSSLQDGTGTDNQTIDTFSFNSVINIVSLEIEDDGIATQTIDLSSLDDEDADWLTIVGSNPPTSSTDDIYTAGNVSIGSTTSIANLNVIHNEVSDGAIDYVQYNSVSNSGNDDKTIIYNSFGSAQAGDNTAIYNLMIGNGSGTYRGMHNYSYASVTGDIYGMFNTFTATGGGDHYGSRTYLSGTGSGLKYGTYNLIASTAGGTHYGVYSDVQKTGSYAGYFIGGMSLGNGNTNRYIMPEIDGSNGQVMTTNGAGVVTFQNIIQSDDQTIDQFDLSGTTLRLSLEDDGQPLQTVNLSSLQDGTGTDDQTIDTFSFNSVSNIVSLEIEDDGIAAQTIDLSSLDDEDADWLTIIGSNIPTSISDNIYTEGSVTIGNSVSSPGALSVYGTNDVYSVYAENDYSPGQHTYSGHFINSGIGTHSRYGIYSTVSGGGGGNRYGTLNGISSASSGWHVGVSNSLNGSNGSLVAGVRNDISTSGTSSLGQYGVFNNLSTTSGSDIDGVYNYITSNGGGEHIGTHNRVLGTGNGAKYGSYNFISSTGSGFKYGVYSYVNSTSGGTHYGIYSDVTKSGSYAGYFRGAVSIGTTTTDQYILPASRGTNGQIMQTDGVGNLSWVNVSGETTTASNGLTETGDDIQLGGTLTQNTTINNGNFDLEISSTGTATEGLSIIKTDNATTSNSALDITKTTNGTGFGTGVNVSMNGTGNGALYTYSANITNTGSGTKIAYNNVFSGSGTGTQYANRNQFLGTGSGTKYGVHNSFATTAISTKYGVYNDFDSSSGNYYGMNNNMVGATNNAVFGVNNTLSGTGTGAKTGLSNNFSGANGNSNIYIGMDNSFSDTGNGDRWGARNNLDGTGTGTHYGVFNDLTGTGSGTKYGSYNYIDSGAGGTHYGVYSEVDNSNGYAGYFIGQSYVSLGLGINNPSPDGRLDIIHNSTGYTSPHIMLTAQNANSGTRITFDNVVETTNHWVMFARADDTSGSGVFNIYSSEVGTNVMRLESDGKMGIMRNPTTNTLEVEGQASKTTAGAFVANSDRRLKKNIESITGETALDKIEKMRGVTYLWNDDKTGSQRPEGIQYGFIAQELMEVFPEKVTKDNLGFYQTAYGDYDPIFVEAIKELKNEVKTLAEENKMLKEKLSKMESIEVRLSALEKNNSIDVISENVSEKKK